MKSSKGLGRGLEAFFGETPTKVNEVVKSSSEKILEKVVELKISEIEPMLNQPRKVFDTEKLEELAASIREHGILQPLLVVKNDNGYTIVAGERRWRAAKLAQLKKVPAIVKDYTDSKKKQVALIENIQREDLNVVEVAKAINELMKLDGYTVTEVAKLTGKNKSTISNVIRLLKLDDVILDALEKGAIVEGHARALLATDDKQKRLEVLSKIIEKNLTVRQVEKIIYGSEEYVRKEVKTEPKTVIYEKIQDKLKEFFGYKVKIDTSTKKQKLIIEFNDDEGLESIIGKFNLKI